MVVLLADGSGRLRERRFRPRAARASPFGDERRCRGSVPLHSSVLGVVAGEQRSLGLRRRVATQGLAVLGAELAVSQTVEWLVGASAVVMIHSRARVLRLCCSPVRPAPTREAPPSLRHAPLGHRLPARHVRRRQHRDGAGAHRHVDHRLRSRLDVGRVRRLAACARRAAPSRATGAAWSARLGRCAGPGVDRRGHRDAEASCRTTRTGEGAAVPSRTDEVAVRTWPLEWRAGASERVRGLCGSVMLSNGRVAHHVIGCDARQAGRQSHGGIRQRACGPRCHG